MAKLLHSLTGNTKITQKVFKNTILSTHTRFLGSQGHNKEFLQILHKRSFQCPKNSADGGDGEIGVPRPECCRVVSVRAVAVTMHEHPSYGDGDLSKSGCGISGLLHSWNGSLSMIHLVMNDAEKLRRAVNGVGAPSMVQTTTSILVVNMLGLVIDKRGPLFIAPWIFGYAILKKVTLSTPGEVVVRCFYFNVPEELLLHDTDR